MRICAFSPWPAPTTVFFTRLGAYSATVKPASRRHQHGDAARLAELEGRRRIGVDEGLFHRRLVRRELLDHRDQPVMDRHQPRAESGACSLVSTEPQATWISRLPSLSIRPQPVRRRPGSMPRMRIGARLHGPVDSPGAPPRLETGEIRNAAPALRIPISPLARPARRPVKQGAPSRVLSSPLIQLPDLAAFPATLHDRGFIAAAAVAVAGRPGARLFRLRLGADLCAADRRALQPRIATVSFVLIDFVCVAPYAVRAFATGAMARDIAGLRRRLLAVPLGTMAQAGQSGAAALGHGGVGARLRRADRRPAGAIRSSRDAFAAAGAGALSGFSGGAVQISGPPVILYWLGGPSAPHHSLQPAGAFCMLVG